MRLTRVNEAITGVIAVTFLKVSLQIPACRFTFILPLAGDLFLLILMRILSFDIEDRMRGLGYYQIAGGLFGLYSTGRMFVQEPVLGGLQFLFYSIAGGLFVFSVYCGNRLRKSEIGGLKTSTWNQILQVVQFNISAIGFSYYSGFRAAIGIQIGDKMIPDAAFSLSGFGLKYTPDGTSEFSLLINLVPFLIIYWLDKLENDIEARKVLISTEEQIMSK